MGGIAGFLASSGFGQELDLRKARSLIWFWIAPCI